MCWSEKMQLAQIVPITAMKCSGLLRPWMVTMDLCGTPHATNAFANAKLCKKKFDQVYWTRTDCTRDSWADLG